MKKILVVMLCIIFVVISTGCELVNTIKSFIPNSNIGIEDGAMPDNVITQPTEKITINPFEKIYVMFLGEAGNGTAKVVINDSSVGLKESYFSIFSNNSLKNGDTVVVTFDAELYSIENPKYQAIKVANKYTVSNLPSQQVISVNPFDYVTISFVGENDNGYAQITSVSNLFNATFFYVNGTNGYLKNGDVITVKFNLNQFAIGNNNYVVSKDYEQYIVRGLVDKADNTLPYDLQVSGSRNGYILPESDTRLYSEAFLSTLTDKQLRYARNEVTARHGRKFTTNELQNYFETRSWYRATYEPEYFDKYVSPTMNTYEHTNMETIKKIEKARKG